MFPIIFLLVLLGLFSPGTSIADCLTPGDTSCRSDERDSEDSRDDEDEEEAERAGEGETGEREASEPDPIARCCADRCPPCSGHMEMVRRGAVEIPEFTPDDPECPPRQGECLTECRRTGCAPETVEEVANDSWPSYGRGKGGGNSVPPRVMWINNGRSLLIWHFTGSGCELTSGAIYGDRTCKAVIRYLTAEGQERVIRKQSDQKIFTIGGSFRQERFGTICPSKAIRHLYQWDNIPPATDVEYIVGCNPATRVERAFGGKWSKMGQDWTRSPNYLPDQDQDVNFAILADVWPKMSSDIFGDRLEDMTTEWVHDSIVRNYFGESPASGDRADFMLWAGDDSNADGCAMEYYESILPIYSDLAAEIPLYMVAGNHDHHCDEGHSYYKMILNPYHDVSRYKNEGGKPPGDNRDRSFYHFNYGNLHILGLNILSEREPTGNREGILNSGLVRPGYAQWRWLNDTLNSLPAGAVTLLFFHSPVDCNDPNRSDFCQLLQQKRVDLVVTGHYELTDVAVRSIQPNPSQRAVPKFILMSGGVCKKSHQDRPGYGPRCSRTLARNFLGYLFVRYRPGEGKIIVESISVNTERWSGTFPSIAHRWVYDLHTQTLNAEF